MREMTGRLISDFGLSSDALIYLVSIEMDSQKFFVSLYFDEVGSEGRYKYLCTKVKLRYTHHDDVHHCKINNGRHDH